jgi:hypothetical protein
LTSEEPMTGPRFLLLRDAIPSAGSENNMILTSVGNSGFAHGGLW